VRRIGVGGEAPFGATGSANALSFHQSLHLVAAAVEPSTFRGLGEFASSVDGVVLLPEILKDRTEFLVAHLTG